MLISFKHNFIFLSAPKCASYSIVQALLPYSDIALLKPTSFRHTTFREYQMYIKPYIKEKSGIDNIETLCLLREPVSWLNSWYRFRSRAKLRNPTHPQHSKCTSHISFAEFIEAYMSPNPPPYAQINADRSQFDFVKDSMGEIGVDTIFLYENIGDFVDYMGQKIGKKLQLTHLNKSPAKMHKSDLFEFLSYFSRKVGVKLKIGAPNISSKLEYKIPDELLKALREFIPQDFNLYETLKKRYASVTTP